VLPGSEAAAKQTLSKTKRAGLGSGPRATPKSERSVIITRSRKGDLDPGKLDIQGKTKGEREGHGPWAGKGKKPIPGLLKKRGYSYTAEALAGREKEKLRVKGKTEMGAGIDNVVSDGKKVNKPSL